VTRVKAAQLGIPFVAARIFNVVGPGQSEGHVCGRFAALVAGSVRGARLEVGPLEPTRDFVDVRDVASALLLLSQKGTRGATYNVGSGRETPIQAVLAALLRSSGLEGRVQIVQQPARAAGVRRHFADVSKLAALGFQPRYALTDSLDAILTYYDELRRRPSPDARPAA
jgi:GDP-4-dehydro-6-deoxy-D-mannose reductase